MNSLFLATLLLTAGSSIEDKLIAGGEVGWTGWYVVLDGVMGGKSTGSFTVNDDGNARFSGVINVNGGGFASIRRSMYLDATDYEGFLIEIEAAQGVDEAPLGVQFSMNDNSYYQYATEFAVPRSKKAGTFTSVYMPMSSINDGRIRGMKCSGCSLNKSRVSSFNLYVLYQIGSYDMTIRSIKAVGKTHVPAIPAVKFGNDASVRNFISETVSSGSYLFNKSYTELCTIVYWSALNSIIAAKGVSKQMKGLACDGLMKALEHPDSDGASRAWELRYAIDDMLDMIDGVEGDWSAGWAKKKAKECSGVSSIGDVKVGFEFSFEDDECRSSENRKACIARESEGCMYSKKFGCKHVCNGEKKKRCRKLESEQCVWNKDTGCQK